MIEEQAGGDLEAWLSSNLISMEAFEAAKQDDYLTFLRFRAEAIHAATLPLAGWSTADAGVLEQAEALEAASDEELAAAAEDVEFAVDESGSGISKSLGASDNAPGKAGDADGEST